MGVNVPGEGPKNARVAFVGEGPGKWEEMKRRCFIGPSGKLLWQFSSKYLHLLRGAVYVTNLVKERLTDAKGKDRAPSDAERREWAPSLFEELGEVEPKFIIAFGRHAAQALLRRPVNMEASHGLPFRAGKHLPWHPIIIPVFHPASGLHQEKLLPYIARGMEMAERVIAGKGPAAFMQPIPPRKYREGLPKKLPTSGSKGWPHRIILGMDTEGPKKDPWSVQVSWAPHEAYLIRASDRKNLERLNQFLEEEKPIIVLHYALHDLKPLLVMGIDLLPAFDAGRVKDTLLYAAGLPGEPGELKALAERHLRLPVKRYAEIVAPIQEEKIANWIFDVALDTTLPWPPAVGRAHSLPKRLLGLTKASRAAKPVPIWKKYHDKKFKAVREAAEKVAGAPPEVGLDDLGEEFKDYACADPDYTRSIYHLLKYRGGEENETSLAIDHAALPLIERMERKGMIYDVEKGRAHIARLHDLKADTQMAGAMLTDGAVKNPSSSHEVQRWCVDTMHFPLTRLTKGRTKESTDDNALKSIRNLHPAINYFIEYRQVVKQIGIMTPLEGMVQEDGRIHYRFNYGKVRTGRRSMGGGDEEEANLLAFPKRGPLGKGSRKCFVAPEGFLFGSCDASQIELRVAAALSQDKEMMGAYQRGDDLHALTAMRMSGCTLEEAQNNDDIRIPWKTANFSLLYLASAETLHETYVAEGITRFSVKKCEQIRKDWFKLYSGIRTYFDWLIAEAKRIGGVRTPFGKFRSLPCIDLKGDDWPISKLRDGDERKACNTPIQGGAFEIIKRAEGRVARLLASEGDWFSPVLEIHDDLMFEFEAQWADKVRERVQAAMTADSPFRGVPLETDWKQGPSWGELEKVKKIIPEKKSPRRKQRR